MPNPHMKNNFVVVTGANGFVAKNLRKFLINKKINVISISRKNFQKNTSEIKIISLQYDEKKLAKKLKNCSAVIHLVGIGKQTVNSDFHTINVLFTKKIIKLCKKVNIKKIIFFSGLGVSDKSTSGYFISKYLAEKEIINSGMDYTILRPSYIIGKGDLLTKHLQKQIRSNLITIPGSGKFRLQPIFIEDVAKIIFQALYSKKYSNKILDLVGPQSVSFKNFVKIFTNNKIKIKKIDIEQAYHDAITNPNSSFGIDDLNILIGNFLGNHEKLKKISNLKFTPLKEALKASSLP